MLAAPWHAPGQSHERRHTLTSRDPSHGQAEIPVHVLSIPIRCFFLSQYLTFQYTGRVHSASQPPGVSPRGVNAVRPRAPHSTGRPLSHALSSASVTFPPLSPRLYNPPAFNGLCNPPLSNPLPFNRLCNFGGEGVVRQTSHRLSHPPPRPNGGWPRQLTPPKQLTYRPYRRNRLKQRTRGPGSARTLPLHPAVQPDPGGFPHGGEND